MFTNVVVSSDENFANFFPIVYYSWKKFFPEVKVSAIFITDREEDDGSILYLKGLFDNFKTQKPINGFPTKNIAKVARFLYASELEGEVSMIEDVDTIPLQRAFFENKVSQRECGKILAVGRECYKNTPHHESFPISTMTAESYLFKELFNPLNLNFENIVKEFEGVLDFKGKNILCDDFSDESFIRKLSQEKSFDKFYHIQRGVNPKNDWIDRSSWRYDKNRLLKGDYVTCNFKRPMQNHIKECQDIFEYISGNSIDYNQLLF
jgi:hypothetical protein